MIEEKCPQHHQIFTDGSYKDGKSGAGVFHPMFEIQDRLENDTPIFTTELHAIYLAISFVNQLTFGGEYLGNPHWFSKCCESPTIP